MAKPLPMCAINVLLVLLLGDPASAKYAVHVPQVADADIELKNYEWFVRNDNARDGTRGMGLAPISLQDTAIPLLSRRPTAVPVAAAGPVQRRR